MDTFVGAVVVGIIAVLLALPMGWATMLLLSALHSGWYLVPALGYWHSVCLYLLCTVLFNSGPTSSSE